MKTASVLSILNMSAFLKSHLFLLPVLYLFYSSCGLTLGDFFLLQGMSALTCLVLDVPMGYLADWVSKKKILITSGILLILRFALLYMWPTKAVIFLGEILFSCVIVSFVGTADSYIYEILQQNNKSSAMLKRYGRLYFWISLGTSISSLSGAWLFDWYGADFVILLTLLFSFISVVLLFFLPETRASSGQGKGAQRYRLLVESVKKAMSQPEMISLIGYSAFLTAAYQIFMWSMQPLMKMAHIPVMLFGVVFFINHMARAGGSYFAHLMANKISVNKLGYIVYVGFCMCFLAGIGVAYQPPVWVSLSLLMFICAMVVFQVMYLITAIARLHDLSDNISRATLASLNSMAGRLITGVCLILSKFILDGYSMQINLMIFMVLFLPSIFFLNKFHSMAK